MSTKKIEIQDHQGNVYHPHTDAKVVFTSDGKTVEQKLEDLKQSASNGKNIVATAIGTPLTSSDTFEVMGNKIDTLTQTFKTNLTAKGVTPGASDKMSNLIDMVGSIELGKKWASGLSVVSSDTIDVGSLSNGVRFQGRYIQLPPLDFVPSTIIATTPKSMGITNYVYGTVYTRHIDYAFSEELPVLGIINQLNTQANPSASSGYRYNITSYNPIKFPVNVSTSYSGKEMMWVAYE